MQSYQFQGAYSFGPGAGRPEKSESKKQVESFVPAPNEYDQLIFVDKPSSPAYTFGYDERITQQVNQLTSSCNYNIPTQIEENLKRKKGPSYGKNSERLKKGGKCEVPQSYIGQDSKSKAPQYVFGYKFDLDEEKRRRDITTPGPGQYYPDEQKQTEEDLFRSTTGWTAFRSSYLQKPSTGLGVGSKDSIYRASSRQNPGPAEYKPKDFICRPNVHGFKFTNKKQYDSYLKVDKSVPGPGQYSPKLAKDIEITSKQKGYTLGPKLQSCMINLNNKDTPPPNAYDIKDITSPQSNIMIGTSTRKPLLEIGVGTPGPGAYQPQLPKKDQLGFSQGNSKRQPLSHTETNNVPGPGSYQTDKSSLNGPKYGMKGKGLKEISAFKFENPSPSQYNPTFSMTKYSSPSYGTNKNQRFFNLADQTPAPNKYFVKYNELRGPKYTFGAKKCKPNNYTIYNKQLEPGPGSYDIPSSIGIIPKYLKQDPSQIYREIGKYAQYIGFIKK